MAFIDLNKSLSTNKGQPNYNQLSTNVCTKRVKKLAVSYRILQRVHISEGALANDVVITTGKEEDLQENLEMWNNMLHEYGIKLKKIQVVSTFQYLGVEVQDNDEENLEVGFINMEEVERNIKVNVFRILFGPVLTV